MRQRYLKQIWIGVLIFLLVAAPLQGKAAAQGGIQIIRNSYESRFALSVTFYLAAESDHPIERIALYRQLVGEKVRVRAEVEFTPAKAVDVQHTWKLEPGDLWPGAKISYNWQIEDAAGNRFQTEPVVFAYQDERFAWQSVSRGLITAHYYGSRGDRAAEVLAAATDVARRLQADIGVALEKPVAIYLYNSQSDMQGALSPRSGIYDARTVTLGVASGGDTLLLLGSHPDLLATVAHEMSHIIVGLATDNPYTELPRWLDEGLAMYAEGELRADNARALQRAIRQDRLISVRSLSSYTGDPSQVDLYYGEVYSLVAFMLETYGREKLIALLSVLREGVAPDEALHQVYGFGLDGLDDAWRIHLGLRPRSEAPATPEVGEREAPVCLGPAGWIIAAARAIISWAR